MESTNPKYYVSGGDYMTIGVYPCKNDLWEISVSKYINLNDLKIEVNNMICPHCLTEMIFNEGLRWYYWECPDCKHKRRFLTHKETYRKNIKNILERDIKIKQIHTEKELNKYLKECAEKYLKNRS